MMDQCVDPPELEDRQLLEFLEGEADESARAHLDRCEYCRRRAQRLAGFRNGVAQKLHRIDCPDSLRLGEYASGWVRGAETQSIRTHLAGCPSCRAELEQLEAFIQATAVEPSESGPFTQIKVLIATLVSGGPGGAAPAAVGLRGEEAGPLIYEADPIRIALQSRTMESHPQQLRVIGLVTGAESSGWEVHLWTDEQLRASTVVDRLGNFHLENLSPGNYELIFESDDMEVHVQDVIIGKAD